MAQAVGRSVEYLVTGIEEHTYPGYTQMALTIAAAADRLDDTGKTEALNLVQSLEKLHPLESTGVGASSKMAT
ncbi:hypothetical protein AGMMS4952_10980 [Spirochaetia bacterium]|nr:hypothetical protein AGMMS4952_10980 [Spirochaetia bacterium]